MMHLRQRLTRRCISAITLTRFLWILGVVLCVLVYALGIGIAHDPENKDLESGEEDPLPSCEELNFRVHELLRIRLSVRNELRSLEKERGLMQSKINELGRQIESLKNEAHHLTTDLDRVKVSLKTSQIALDEFNLRNTPEIRAPLQLKSSNAPEERLAPVHSNCISMNNCFDYSRCSLSSGFPIHYYNGSKDSRPGKEACLFVVSFNYHLDASKLTFWGGDGRNHLLHCPFVPKLPPHRAILVSQFSLSELSFRPGFDVPIPPPRNTKIPLRDIVPLRRKYLLTYRTVDGVNKELMHYVQKIQSDQTDDRAYIIQTNKANAYENSTFAIIDPLKKDFQRQLLNCLQQGTIPVILFPESGSIPFHELILPFAEVVDWRLASVFLDYHRIPEMHFLLRSYPDSDLFYLKRQGRMILVEYFTQPLQTAINVVRERIGLPPRSYTETSSIGIFNDTFKKEIMEQLPPDYESNESLGPLEPPFPSASFRRNFSSLAVHRYKTWNEIFKPFYASPHTPWEPVLPTEAKFLGSSGFRPINGGQGGTGVEFAQAIGGNIVNEQFTIVVLTYEREQVLMNSLARLYGLPYLNKVIVVWNSPNLPPEDLAWPDIGVEIFVIKADKNSLNNRFQPFKAIETEAVLSIDDDAHLRHDEIIFGFRVWRENRDRLVGFPGRFHEWDSTHSSWNYNSNYSCELSMVLTGAAFYHKYYSYLYTYEMPQEIREKVDEFMNCEDLAMNFLVSHVTRKPPVKVTSRWTFRCPGCPVSLSEYDSHFLERHQCINFFREIYGYMPLLYTQYRADSVLFKTRIPPDKQKCFKFI
uniref:glucuronosyl-galactosyl-proteoglycan 4-alpha-N-acetylglucosaminyltransferase n=1 Tax=Lepeophtheirus salmonis TaxID=72036 RepID=A0A0K2TLB0_LEPSM